MPLTKRSVEGVAKKAFKPKKVVDAPTVIWLLIPVLSNFHELVGVLVLVYAKGYQANKPALVLKKVGRWFTSLKLLMYA